MQADFIHYYEVPHGIEEYRNSVSFAGLTQLFDSLISSERRLNFGSTYKASMSYVSRRRRWDGRLTDYRR